MSCYRRYEGRQRKADISYYNTTVRTRLKTAICLEGISCKPEEDMTRCRILHSKCNEHVNTSDLPFKLRVTLSECTVEDILCHLGHRSPVMCCQDKYSVCVDSLVRTSHSENGKSQATETPAFFVLENINDSLEGEVGQENADIISQIANQLSLNPDSVINVGNKTLFDSANLLSIDNETIPIIQDFVVVLDDSNGLNNTLISGDGTIQNILNSLNSNSNDFKIIFDPDSTQVGLDEDFDPGSLSILEDIKTSINDAVSSVAEVCSNNICIQNLASPDNISVINKTSSSSVGLITVESKSEVLERLEQCRSALECLEREGEVCMLGETKCLSLSNIDLLPGNTRRGLAECKIQSLDCLTGATAVMEQAECRKMFSTCTAGLGVDISEGSILNFIEPDEKTVSAGDWEEISGEIMQTLRDNLNSELGQNFNVDIVADTASDDSDILVDLEDIVSLTNSSIAEESVPTTTVKSVTKSEDIVSLIKTKLNASKTNPVKIRLEQNSSDKFQMDLPMLGLAISVKEEPDVQESSFGMSLPPFGFNITVDKDPSQCELNGEIFDDFEEVPSRDPCQLCKCSVGEITCFTRSCPPPPDRRCRAIQVSQDSACCPLFDCDLGRQDQGPGDIEDTLEMLNKVKDSLISVLNNANDAVNDKTRPSKITTDSNDKSQSTDIDTTYTDYDYSSAETEDVRFPSSPTVKMEEIDGNSDSIITDTNAGEAVSDGPGFLDSALSSISSAGNKERGNTPTGSPVEPEKVIGSDQEDEQKEAENKNNDDKSSDITGDGVRGATEETTPSQVDVRNSSSSVDLSDLPRTVDTVSIELTATEKISVERKENSEARPKLDTSKPTKEPSLELSSPSTTVGTQSIDPSGTEKTETTDKENIGSNPSVKSTTELSLDVSGLSGTVDTNSIDLSTEKTETTEIENVGGNLDVNPTVKPSTDLDTINTDKTDVPTEGIAMGSEVADSKTTATPYVDLSDLSGTVDTNSVQTETLLNKPKVEIALATKVPTSTESSSQETTIEEEDSTQHDISGLSRTVDTSSIKSSGETGGSDEAGSEETERVTRVSLTESTTINNRLPQTEKSSAEEFTTNPNTLSIIGDKNVKVFLNFTWLNESFVLDEDFYNPEYTQNLTEKIKDKLASGVGYVIVPDGKEPETVDENTIHLLQTIKVDHNGNIDIDTNILNDEGTTYSDYDKDFILEVENKTLEVTEDIFKEMQNDPLVTTTESLQSTKIAAKDEIKSDTSQLSVFGNNLEENNSSTDPVTGGQTLNDTQSPVIYISLNDLDSSTRKNGEKNLDFEKLRAEVESDTGFRTILIDNDSEGSLSEELGQFENVFLLQGEIFKEPEVDLKIYKNTVPLDMLEDEEKQEAAAIKNLVDTEVQNLLLSISTESPSSIPSAMIDQEEEVEQTVLEAVSKIMGLTILNHNTDTADNETLHIFQDILVNTDQLESLSGILRSGAEIQEEDIPSDIRDLIVAALNQSDLTPLESDILVGPDTTPSTTLVRDQALDGTLREDHSSPVPATEPESSESILNSDPIILLSVKPANGTTETDDLNLLRNLEQTTGITTINVSGEEEEAISSLLSQNSDSFLVEAAEDESGHLTVNISHNSVPLDPLSDLSDMEVLVLQEINSIAEHSNTNTPSDPLVRIREEILKNLGNVSNIMLLNETGVFSEDDGETLLIFQDILIDGSGNFNVSSVVDNGNEFSNLPSTIQDAVLQALNTSALNTIALRPHDQTDHSIDHTDHQRDQANDQMEEDGADTPLDRIRFEFEEESDGDNGDFNEDNHIIPELQKPNTMKNKAEETVISGDNLSLVATNIGNIQIVVPTQSFSQITQFQKEIIPLILNEVMSSGIGLPVVHFMSSDSPAEDLENSLLINYANCSVTFDNQELKALENKQIEKILAIFEEVDRVVKDSIERLSLDLELCQNETEEEEVVSGNAGEEKRQETKIEAQSGSEEVLVERDDDETLLLISLRANDEDDVSNPELLEETIASKIYKNVLVEVSKKSEIVESSSDRKNLVTVAADITTLSSPRVIFPDKRIQKILTENDQTNLRQEIEDFVAKLSVTKSEDNGLVVIAVDCAANCQTLHSKFELVKNSVEELTDIQTIIFLEEDEQTTKNDEKGHVKYLFNISISEQDNSYGDIAITGTSNRSGEAALESQTRIIEAVKKVIDEVYETNLEFESEFKSKTTTEAGDDVPRPNEKSSDRIIDILGDLFVKTLDLSFKIKGAMDRNSENEEVVEFDIISRKDNTDNDDYLEEEEGFQVPNLIKITPEDAMFVHDNIEEEEANNGDESVVKKPIVIDLENDESISLNVSNGTVLEIDLSDLPTDAAEREEEIRQRVKSFINGLKIITDKDSAEEETGVDKTTISDAIIKNITQIVLLQMDQALSKQEVTSQRIFDLISSTAGAPVEELTTGSGVIDSTGPASAPPADDDEGLTTEITTESFINQQGNPTFNVLQIYID